MDYHDATLSPYEEFQLFKQSLSISPLLTNGKRLEYGARVIYEGGKLGVLTFFLLLIIAM